MSFSVYESEIFMYLKYFHIAISNIFITKQNFKWGKLILTFVATTAFIIYFIKVFKTA